MENPFKAGDVVRLKSETGPLLTITGISGIYVDCLYWNEKECEFRSLPKQLMFDSFKKHSA